MLRCPQCGNTYTDPTLRFCLADGTGLVPAQHEPNVRADEPVTVRMETPRPTSANAAPAKAPRTFKIVLGLLALVVVVGSFAVVALLIFVNRARVRQPTPPPAPAAAANATSGAQEQRVERALAEVQRKLEQANASRANAAPVQQTGAAARVNSPNDGFLALRELPDTGTGEPLAKIPHGTTITLGECRPAISKVSGRTGRWCAASYGGKTGWVFDAWLVRASR